MTLLESVKPFWPLLFTFILPRAISYYQALKTSVRTRPPPRPLPSRASRSLNIIFVAICVFLWLSFAPSSTSNIANVFRTTKTRLQAPTDVVFSRLAAMRKNGLTPDDEALRAKLTNLPLRQIYLRYGPSTLVSCPFCHPDDPLTYALHHLPTHILPSHLLNILVTGLSTSRTISGPSPSHFRLKSTMCATVLLVLDVWFTTMNEPVYDINMPSPPSQYVTTTTLRPLILCVFNAILAFLIYACATGRFVFFPFLASASAAEDTDAEELMQQTNVLLNETNVALQMAQMKLRGLNVTKNTVARNETLKNAEGRYWEMVRRVENDSVSSSAHLDDGVFEDEDVQAAIARAFGSGNVDVGGMRREAEGFVREVTRGLE